MPRSRHPLDYPISRLYLQVGLARASWLPLLGVVAPEARGELEGRMAELLGLDEAVQAGLLSGYSFQWGRSGRLRGVRLQPVERLRNTPGIAELKRLFFGPMC